MIAGGTAQRPVVRYSSWELATRGGSTSGGAVPRIQPDTLQASVTDPRGHTTRMRLNARFQPLRVVGPVADTTTTWYNGHGQPEAVTGPTGAYTTYTWSGPNLVASQTSHEDAAWSGEYDEFGMPTVSITGGLRVTNRYGAHGELLRSWVGQDSTRATVFTYHAGDQYRIASITEPGGNQTEFEYDAAGFQNLREVTVTTPDSTTRTVTHFDDAYGRPDSTADASGTVRFDFDLLNRQTLVVGPLQDSTEFAYAESDTAHTVTDAVGKVYTFRSNRLGWLVSELFPNGASRSFAYNLGGMLTRRTDRRGLAVDWSYDAAGRVTQERAGSDTTDFAYGPFASYYVAAVRRANGSEFSRDTVFYDPLGRVTREYTTVNGFTWTRRSFLRREGLRDSVGYTTPGGSRMIRFRYDDMARLNRLTSPVDVSDSTRLFYGAAARLDSLRLPTGLKQRFTYAPTHQPRTQTWSHTAVSSAFSRIWHYDDLGRVNEREVLHQRRRLYGYDTGGRLASVSDSTYFDEIVCTDPEDLNTCQRQTGWNPAGDATYTYDQVGNRTDSNASLYPNTNRYHLFAGDSLLYDAEGNLTRRIQPGDDQFLYWNELGQLDSVVTGSTTVSYGYNGFGQRIKRTQGSSVTLSIYDGDDLLLEADGSNTVLREYLHYPGIDLPHSVRIGGTTYFYAMEQPGHVVGLASGTGTVAQRYRYSAWGVAEQDSGSLTQPLRFMAREFDGGTGLLYVRNRWYDSELGRFVSEDPIGFGGGINVYSYVGNDPVGSRDPLGLCFFGDHAVLSGRYTESTPRGFRWFTSGGEQFYWFEYEGHWVICRPTELAVPPLLSANRSRTGPTIGPYSGYRPTAPTMRMQCIMAGGLAIAAVAEDAATLAGVGLVMKGYKGYRGAKGALALSAARRIVDDRLIQIPQERRLWGRSMMLATRDATATVVRGSVTHTSLSLGWNGSELLKDLVPIANAYDAYEDAQTVCAR